MELPFCGLKMVKYSVIFVWVHSSVCVHTHTWVWVSMASVPHQNLHYQNWEGDECHVGDLASSLTGVWKEREAVERSIDCNRKSQLESSGPWDSKILPLGNHSWPLFCIHGSQVCSNPWELPLGWCLSPWSVLAISLGCLLLQAANPVRANSRVSLVYP
jgi:hypothetical protein